MAAEAAYNPLFVTAAHGLATAASPILAVHGCLHAVQQCMFAMPANANLDTGIDVKFYYLLDCRQL